MAEGGLFSVTIKWNKQEIPFEIVESGTLGDLKRRIEEITQVPIKRQKILGLKGKDGKAVNNDEAALQTITSKQKVVMMGTPEKQTLVEPEEEFQIIDDFDYNPADIDVKDQEINLRKIENRIQTLKIKEMNPPREGKKCLVLDIDYTLFDHRSTVEHPLQLMRPYLHEFLTAVYPFYDIVIWSATSMKWIELKMKELGVFSNENYKITFCIDRAAMITVSTEWKGSQKVFDAKGLGVIWGKYPKFYNKNNTIHLDDLARNFIMNPDCGLKIRPFKNCLVNHKTDNELLKLLDYLIPITELESFEGLNHDRWERWVEKNKK